MVNIIRINWVFFFVRFVYVLILSTVVTLKKLQDIVMREEMSFS